jgi:NAD(P)-dependent dehydrogenase (short-subunit alcohol dehydrogenase family)
MPSWTAADLPSFAGRTVVVTGANSGLGRIAAGELARAGARVVLAVRDVEKGKQAASEMAGDVEVRRLDLQDLASVREFADGTGAFDVLINNAGIMATPYAKTSDGFESQLGTNHLGHFALTNLLLPKISDRVVTISSNFHYLGHIELGDLNWERRRYNAWLAYSQSKLANLLFTSELQRRLAQAGSPVRSLAAHPGYSHTSLMGKSGRGLEDAVVRFGGRLFASDPEYGARQTLFAASQDLPGNTYIGPRFGFRGPTQAVGRSRRARQPAMATALWELSSQLTDTKFSL